MNKYLIPLVSFAIFLFPLVMDAIQIDFEATSNLPVQWQLVFSALFSGGVATVLTIMRQLYKDFQVDYDKEIADLHNQIKVLEIGRDLDEKKIMLTTATLNDEWLEKNVTIQQCEQLLDILKSKTSKIKEQQDLLAEAVNGMTKAQDEVLAGNINPELLEVTKELEKLEK